MKPSQVRELFINIVSTHLSSVGFEIEKKSKSAHSGQYVVYHMKQGESVWYDFQLTFTSYLHVQPHLNVYHKEIVGIVKMIDEAAFKHGMGNTFSSNIFEYFKEQNADGYLNVTSSLYLPIDEPFEKLTITHQAEEFCTSKLIPFMDSIVQGTNSLEKADKLINEQFPVKRKKKNGISRVFFDKRKQDWTTCVLCEFIPDQMAMSLLLAKVFNRSELPVLLKDFSEYLNIQKIENNSSMRLLSNVIRYVKAN